MTKTLATFAFMASAALGLAAPAGAAETNDRAFRVAIPVADLDLHTEEGRKALLKRSRVAAQRTCAPDVWPKSHDSAEFEACRAAFERAAESALAASGQSSR
jgi:UrcA family protein